MNFFSLFKRNLINKLKKKINIDSQNFKNKKSLDELFHYYGSDKAETFKITNESGHGFSKFYTENLNQYKDKKLKILDLAFNSEINIEELEYNLKNKNLKKFVTNYKDSIIFKKTLIKFLPSKLL